MTIDQVRKYSRSKTKVQKAAMFAQVLLYLTYFLMELLQFLQYYFGLVDSCGSTSNKVLTVVGHFLVWIQPLAHNYWCLYNTLKGKTLFRYCILISTMCLVVSSISLYLGVNGLLGYTPNQIPQDHLLSKDFTLDGYGTQAKVFGVVLPNIGSQLCSYQGPNHMYWMFPYHPLWGYAPHGFSWMTAALIPHFFRYHGTNDFFASNIFTAVLSISGWVVSAIVCFFIGTPHEIWSFWCLISVPYLVIPYIFPVVWKDILRLELPTHFNENAELEKRKNEKNE
jgi:hypothetical protein